jgi:hypothetical protein
VGGSNATQKPVNQADTQGDGFLIN